MCETASMILDLCVHLSKINDTLIVFQDHEHTQTQHNNRVEKSVCVVWR